MATRSASVTSIPTATLTHTWENTLSLHGGRHQLHHDWICLPGGTNAPIDLYIAQNGSGTESTWSTSSA